MKNLDGETERRGRFGKQETDVAGRVLQGDRQGKVYRQTYLTDGVRHENDAEHAWHMAVMALVLGEYANEDIDMLKVVSMLLIHDVVEIDSGDTYAYNDEGVKTQRSREEKAADRIFAILPKD